MYIISMIEDDHADFQKCGLELTQLEELERNGIQFGDIVPFFEERGQPLCFHAPSGLFKVQSIQ